MTPRVPVLIGIDVGTSAVKAAAFGGGGLRGKVVAQSITTAVPHPGWSEQDPESIRTALLSALGGCVASLDGAPVAGVVLCSALHGLIGLGGDDRPVTPFVTWADDRATELVGEWHDRGIGAFLHERTGVPLHPVAPVTKVVWYATHDPERAARVARWADLKALVVSWLTGEVVTEWSSASGWGLMDIRAHVWDSDALALAGLDAERLPALDRPTATRRLRDEVASQVGLSKRTVVVLGAADGPLGNVGVGALTPGVAALSLGTSGAVRVVVDRVPPTCPSLFCYALTEDRWVLGGAVSNGGGVTSWLADILGGGASAGDDDIAAMMDLAASAPPGSDGLVMIPYLLSERSPLWDPTLAGAYLGLRRRHTRAHLARAALEGVCAGLRAVLDSIDEVQGVQEVRATGGALRAPVWGEVLAATLGRPTRVVHASDGSALGAAALGLMALGEASDLEEARGLIGSETLPPPVQVRAEVSNAASATRSAFSRLAAQTARAADALGG